MAAIVGARVCAAADCRRPVECRGWCEMHYARWRRNGDPEIITVLRGVDPRERFWAKVDASDSAACWPWSGKRDAAGYGRFSVRRRVEVMAHRFAYEDAIGPIHTGLEIDHLCRAPSCINPSHLEAVTSKVNQERRAAVITHCPQGHPYSGDNLYIPPNGRRRCRECARDATRRWRVRRHG